MVEAPNLLALIDDAEDVLALVAGIGGIRIAVAGIEGGVVRTFGDAPSTGDAAETTLRIEAEPVATLRVEGARPEEAMQLAQMCLQAAYRRKLVVGMYEETLSGSYAELAERNRQLEALNASLAGQVRERTRELDEAHVKLAAEERAAAVGRLAAGVAHELNTPLACVRSNLGCLVEAVAGSGEAAEAARESIDMVDRAARIVKDLRSFSHVDEMGPTPCNLNRELDAALSQLTVPSGVTIEKDYGAIPSVPAEGAQIAVALLRLLENARDAVAEDGRIRLITRTLDGGVSAEICDDGPGVAGELRSHLFEPFFTTKDVGSGTGLGLTVARNVARAHGGDLELLFPPSGGTVARFTLGSPMTGSVR